MMSITLLAACTSTRPERGRLPVPGSVDRVADDRRPPSAVRQRRAPARRRRCHRRQSGNSALGGPIRRPGRRRTGRPGPPVPAASQKGLRVREPPERALALRRTGCGGAVSCGRRVHGARWLRVRGGTESRRAEDDGRRPRGRCRARGEPSPPRARRPRLAQRHAGGNGRWATSLSTTGVAHLPVGVADCPAQRGEGGARLSGAGSVGRVSSRSVDRDFRRPRLEGPRPVSRPALPLSSRTAPLELDLAGTGRLAPPRRRRSGLPPSARDGP